MSKIDEYKQLWHDECIKEGNIVWKECKVDERVNLAITLKEGSITVFVPTEKQTVFEYYCNYQGMVFEYVGRSSADASGDEYSLSGWDGGLLE